MKRGKTSSGVIAIRLLRLLVLLLLLPLLFSANISGEPMSRVLRQMRLTQNFSLWEFLVSRDYPGLAQALSPTIYEINNLFLLCATILQPTREYLDCKIWISSGFRSNELNGAVKGSRKSLHLLGKAADIFPSNMQKIADIYDFIGDQLPHAYQELIWYKNKNIIHVAIPQPNRPKKRKIKN